VSVVRTSKFLGMLIQTKIMPDMVTHALCSKHSHNNVVTYCTSSAAVSHKIPIQGISVQTQHRLMTTRNLHCSLTESQKQTQSNAEIYTKNSAVKITKAQTENGWNRLQQSN